MVLLVDSGSTLVPIVEKIAQEAVNAVHRQESWIGERSFSIYTNSLAGALALMEHGRIVAGDPYSELALDSHVLPGEPLATFAAVAGNETELALEAIPREPQSDATRPGSWRQTRRTRIIGLTTGNWVRIRRSGPRCPVPLARGKGHLPFKQRLLAKSDEVYVIAPLGKIFVKSSNAKINEELGYRKDSPDKAKEPYDELQVFGPDVLKTKLVTTIRPGDKYLLSRLSQELISIFNDDDGTDRGPPIATTPLKPDVMANSDIADLPHIAFPYVFRIRHPVLELEMEFPHHHTRDPLILRNLFHLPDSAINRVYPTTVNDAIDDA